jgi:hypothetical protein
MVNTKEIFEKIQKRFKDSKYLFIIGAVIMVLGVIGSIYAFSNFSNTQRNDSNQAESSKEDETLEEERADVARDNMEEEDDGNNDEDEDENGDEDSQGDSAETSNTDSGDASGTNQTNNNTDQNSSQTEDDDSPTFENPDDYSDKIELGQNGNYIVWLINPEVGGAEKKGQFLIELKNSSTANNGVKIDEEVSIFGTSGISGDFDNKYIIVSSGTSPASGAYAINVDRADIINEFGISSKIYYYDNSIYYNNCDEEINRGIAGPSAPSVETLNMLNGNIQVMYQSDELKHYGVTGLSGNSLEIRKTYVESGDDWRDQSKIQTEDFVHEL